MKKSFYLFIFLTIIIFFISNASAAINSKVTLQGPHHHDVYIQIAKPTDKTIIDTVVGNLGENAEMTFDVISDLNLDELTFFVVVRLFGEVVEERWFENIPIESNIELSLFNEEELQKMEEAEKARESDNAVIQEVVESAPEEIVEDKKITGLAFFSELKILSGRNLYYAIAGILFIGLLFIVIRKRGIFRSGNPPHARSYSSLEDEIKDAQRKIKEAQEEIRQIKKMKNINPELEEAEIEFQKAKERLDKLKGAEREPQRSVKRERKPFTSNIQEPQTIKPVDASNLLKDSEEKPSS